MVEVHTVTIVNYAVHDRDVTAPVRVPAVRVLGRVLALGEPADVNVVKHYIRGVGDEMIILRTVAEHKVRDNTIMEAVDADQHGPQRVNVGGVQVIPCLSVAVKGSTYRARQCLLIIPPLLVCDIIASPLPNERMGARFIVVIGEEDRRQNRRKGDCPHACGSTTDGQHSGNGTHRQTLQPSQFVTK